MARDKVSRKRSVFVSLVTTQPKTIAVITKNGQITSTAANLHAADNTGDYSQRQQGKESIIRSIYASMRGAMAIDRKPVRAFEAGPPNSRQRKRITDGYYMIVLGRFYISEFRSVRNLELLNSSNSSMSNLGYIQMSLKDPLLSVSLFCHLASIILCALILSDTGAL